MSPTSRRGVAGPPWPWRTAMAVAIGVLRYLLGWRVQARRPAVLPPPDQPLVVVVNHTSNVDVFLVAEVVWRRLGHWVQPLAKAEIFDVPVLGSLARRAGAIPVVRGDEASREAAYDHAVARLREGGTLVVAPEATTTHDGTLLPLRHGAARLALQAGVDMLVVTHFGAQRGFSPVARVAERNVVVTMAVDLLTPWAGEDVEGLTGRIAATMLDRSQQLRATYPQADPDARWWPPYAPPAPPSATARDNLERFRDTMADQVLRARRRMAQLAREHEVDERVATIRGRATELGERTRQQIDQLNDRVRERAEDLSTRARERAPERRRADPPGQRRDGPTP